MASSPETAPSQGNNNEESPPADSDLDYDLSPSEQSPAPPVESPPTESTSESPPPPPPSPPAVKSPPPDLPTSPPPNPPTSPPPPPPKSSPPEPPEEPPPSPPPPSPPPPTTPSSPPTQNSPSQPPPTSTTPSQSPPPPPINSGPPPQQNSSPPPPSSPSSPPAPTNPTPTPISPPRTPSPPASAILSPPQTPPSPILSPPPPALTPSNGSSGSSSPASGSPLSPTHLAIIAGIVFGGVLVLAVFIICLIFSRRKKKTPRYMDPEHPLNCSNSPQPIAKLSPAPDGMGTPPPFQANTSGYSSGHSGRNHTPPSPNMGGIGAKSQFTYEELAIATRRFAQCNLLGQGGFGLVHKGILPDGKEVAVKSLKAGSGQGEREFQAEVEIISRVHHRHLVSLVGYCIADGQRMLVYEFVPNKTLEFHLHGKGQPVMNWATRVRIAVGSAKGLAYLHEDCHPRIIHRDIKAANILLDFNFEAMVADFGLAKLSSDNFTHVSTRVMGTFGYLAPEYASSGKLTDKSDVFSFGVMLLELITGRRPVDTTNLIMEDSLVDWARPRLSKALEDGNYSELVDRRLEDNYAPHEMTRMVTCAAASIRHSARRRPKMSQIVRALDGDSSLDDLNEGVKPGQSAMYNPNGNTEKYDTCAYNADMTKFRKMVMSSQEFNSSEYGATSDYGHNPYSSSNESPDIVSTNIDIRKL